MIPNKHKQKRSACTAVLPVRGVLRCADPCADRCAAGWLHLRGAVRCAVRCAARCGALRRPMRGQDRCAAGWLHLRGARWLQLQAQAVPCF